MLDRFNLSLQQHNKQAEWHLDRPVIKNDALLWNVRLHVDGEYWGCDSGSTLQAIHDGLAKHGLWLMDWEGHILTISGG